MEPSASDCGYRADPQPARALESFVAQIVATIAEAESSTNTDHDFSSFLGQGIQTNPQGTRSPR
jgi:hypothetical protein